MQSVCRQSSNRIRVVAVVLEASRMHLVCGEALYDVFVESDEPGSTGEVAMRAVAGGSPFNVAIGMARLGAVVGFASDLARDVLGDRLAVQLMKEGITDQFLRRSASGTALAIVTNDAAGKPSYRFSGLEQASYWPADDAVERAEESISGIHVGSIATVLPASSRSLLKLVRRFADRALVSLDPNVRLAIVPDGGTWRHAIEDLRSFSHVIKVSEEDLVALYPDAKPEDVCRTWLDGRTALVVLTRGADGATMFTGSAGPVHIPAVHTRVVDTVGAGDSFMAALLAMLRRRGWHSANIVASLDVPQLRALGGFAALAASVTCSRRGPMLPTAAELDAHREPPESCR